MKTLWGPFNKSTNPVMKTYALRSNSVQTMPPLNINTLNVKFSTYEFDQDKNTQCIAV